MTIRVCPGCEGMKRRGSPLDQPDPDGLHRCSRHSLRPEYAQARKANAKLGGRAKGRPSERKNGRSGGSHGAPEGAVKLPKDLGEQFDSREGRRDLLVKLYRRLWSDFTPAAARVMKDILQALEESDPGDEENTPESLLLGLVAELEAEEDGETVA